MLRLYTLGELRLDNADGETLTRRRKPLVLLAYLCRRAPRPVSRAELAALVWGERQETKARQSLRQALFELKRHLADSLAFEQDSVALARGSVELDVIAFELDADEGRDQAAIDRWHGDFLATAEDGAELSLSSWMESERAALHRRLGIVFERLLHDAERRGQWTEAITVARRWCDALPYDERACRGLIGALRLGGQDLAATAAHAAFIATLRDALEVQPSREFMELGAALDHASLTTTDESAAAAPALSFVGRDALFARLTNDWRRARQGQCVVALVEGAAGMGISRLCQELANWAAASDSRTVVLSTNLGAAARARLDGWSGARLLFPKLSGAPELAGVSPETLATIATVVPSLRERFPRAVKVPRESTTAAVIDAMREAVAAITEETPLLVIADGIARTDAESRALLLSLAAMRDLPLMFVFADSTSAIDGDPALAALRDDAAVARIPLAPLTTDDIAALVNGDAALAGRLHADTGGIPALVAAQLDALIAERLLVPSASGWSVASPALGGRALPTPAATRALVREISRTLDENGRRVLEAIAVFGAPLSAIDAATLSHAPPEATLRAAETMLRSGYLDREADGRVQLGPPLLARAAYNLVPTLRRESLHAEAATLLNARRRRSWRERGALGARVAYHEQRAGGTMARLTLRRRRRFLLVGASALATLALVAFAIERSRESGVRPRTVAVLPFDVRGGADVAFLRAGMVDLLSTSLNGAAGLRTLNPRTVLAADRDRAAQVLTPDEARRIATGLGASLFVLGEAVGAQGKLQLNATLYDVRDASAPIAHAQAEGRADSLFALVDRVTAQLAVSVGASPRDRFTQLAALTTSSLDALKAYLEGEAAYRSQQMPLALTAFKRAVASDSTFSLAWYRQASAASWMLLTDDERHAANQAVRTSGRLSERDRTLVEAFAAYSRGAADTAERLAGTIAETYGDIEAWVILGETLYHHNWKRGRSLSESRKAWERVLAFDPHYWPALQHLAEVAAIEGKREETDSLLETYERSVGAEHIFLPSHVFYRFAFGDRREQDQIVSRLSGDGGFWVITSTWYVSIFARDIPGAERIAQLLVDPIRPPEQQGFGRVLLAHLALARGKWREARAQLAIAAVHTPARAIEHEALLSLAPFLAESTTVLATRRDSLRRLDATELGAPSAMRWPNTDAPLHNLVRAYLRGLINARRGDSAAVAGALADLDSLPDPSGSIAIAQGFRHAVRAERARTRGARAEALAGFERSSRPSPFVAGWTSAFISQPYERYERAELLASIGRDDEALRWYATFNENSPYDLVYLAPSLYKQGLINERHGNRRAANEAYRRFVTLWRDCDPELRPMVQDASRRLLALAPQSR